MKTPEEVKDALAYHGDTICDKRCSYHKWQGTGYDCSSILCQDALAYIEYLESQIPSWMPVKDIMPAQWQYVLVIDHYDEDAWEPSIAFWDGEKWTIANETVVARVTHWMAIPKPPKEE